MFKRKDTYTEHSAPEQTVKRRELLLTRVECDALRGLAIIGIFLHNYCHWLRPVVKENEYQYFQRNVDKLYQVLQGRGTNCSSSISFRSSGIMEYLYSSSYRLTV